LLIARQNEERENKQGDAETHRDSPSQPICVAAGVKVVARLSMQGLCV
jgi:hypothetical protein